MRNDSPANTAYRYWSDDLGTWIYTFQSELPSGGRGWILRKQPYTPKHESMASDTPGGLLGLRPDGTLNRATQKKLDEAWSTFCKLNDPENDCCATFVVSMSVTSAMFTVRHE
ncbi:hypothetical protein AD006_01095 [Pseudonocardia sp. EC080610-09]|nr:hypothetical protein FRP1_21925 [Pseudonocardia sp. EC080625-04]ALL74266.1 hypothetical protein AD006_01095 [Pseudonocardia sp. EC080610-09]ALL81289.1 hypothetical protein AD017_08920 [Pseudonocardia sp. EC080619-01]